VLPKFWEPPVFLQRLLVANAKGAVMLSELLSNFSVTASQSNAIFLKPVKNIYALEVKIIFYNLMDSQA
jgi:hypothetical protein